MVHNIKAPSSRYIAAEALCSLYQGQKAIKPILEKMCKDAGISPAERALAMNICFGVLRNRHSLDLAIRSLISIRLKKLHPHLHQALAVALYQIFFLNGIPESAAVNEAVKSCQKAKVPKKLQGFANGVLRNALRKKEELEKKYIHDDNHNHPDWMVKRWQKHHGEVETDRICALNNKEPILNIRIQKKAQENFISLLDEADIAYTPGHLPESLTLANYRGSITALPGYQEGFFQVQDQAAQLASHLLGPFTGKNYLDCCAGLGGKTSHIVDLVPNTAQVIAIEPEVSRSEKFHENMKRLFPEKQFELKSQTAQEFAQETDQHFDGIFIDAPCSGTGVIRRQPDIRWNRNPEDFICNQDLQLEILQSIAPLVAINGVIVYATCSLEPEENTQVIDIFLQNNPDYILTSCAPFLPQTAHEHIRQHGDADIFAPRPNDAIDGFFAARLLRIK